MVTTISGPNTSATPVELNGATSSTSTGSSTNGLLLSEPAVENGGRSRTQSRRASNQR